MSLKHSLVLTTALVAAVASAQDAAKPQAEQPPKPPEGWKYVTAKDGSYQFLFPGLGHGAFLFNDCPTNIGIAFYDNPTAKPDGSCITTMGEPQFQ